MKHEARDNWKIRCFDYATCDQEFLRKKEQLNALQHARKGSSRRIDLAVPQTDTGGRVENTKVNGRTAVKELGNIAGRNFERCPPASRPVRAVGAGAVKDAERLFNKNTGLCKPERGCIGADTCPVLEG